MQWNEFKYGFYPQNYACFLKYVFQFFINMTLPGSNTVKQQNFMGESDKDN